MVVGWLAVLTVEDTLVSVSNQEGTVNRVLITRSSSEVYIFRDDLRTILDSVEIWYIEIC